MRKTRLVILPTKCLHQMGFLLLFLSCPVIGDWGRIRPESETSHDAIQIERKGTCGLQRDFPGGLLDILDANGFDQCRQSEFNDMKKPITREESYVRRSDLWRLGQRTDENRMNVRESFRRRVVDERRDDRREGEVERNFATRDLRIARERLESRRSRSVETQRTVRSRSLERRNDVRSLSLSRLEEESRTMRRQQSVERNDARARRQIASDARARREMSNDVRVRREVSNDSRREVANEGSSRKASERRLSLARRTLESENERRVEQQRRMNREVRNDRRENERTVRGITERRERQNSERTVRDVTKRRERQDSERTFRRSTERREVERTTGLEKRETRRENDERSIQRLALSRRENEMSRRVAVQGRAERNVIQERRLSSARIEQERTQNRERSENRRTSDSGRRLAEIRKSQSLEFRRSIEELEKSRTLAKNVDSRRETEIRRSVPLLPKISAERRVSRLNEKMVERSDEPRTSRVEPILKKMIESNDLNDNEAFFGGIMKRMGLKNYPIIEVGDWTTNCVIGVAAYFLHSKQAKAA